MIRHEIQNEVHAAPGEFLSGHGKTFGTTQVLLDHETTHAIGRSDIIPRTKIRKCLAEIFKELLVNVGEMSARHPKEKNPVEIRIAELARRRLPNGLKELPESPSANGDGGGRPSG